MKKLIILGIINIAIMTIVFSCKEEKKVQKVHIHKKAEAHQIVYECPMKCEKGKFYDISGKCPICKMSLIKIEHEENKNHLEHNHK